MTVKSVDKARTRKRVSEVILEFPEDKSEMKVTVKFGRNDTQIIKTFSFNGMISFFVSEAGKPEVLLTT